MRTVGIEAANSFVKSKSDKGEVTYLNTVRQRTETEELVFAGSDVFGRSGGERYKYDGRTYTVGDFTDFISSSGRDEDRYSRDQFRLENVLGIAQHVENGDEVRVVTGLPAKHYSDSSRNTIVNGLTGTHTVFVDGSPRTFEVKDVQVILQPLGTLTHLLIRDDGSPRSEGIELTKTGKKSLVVDIGWGTTDVAIMEASSLMDYFGIDTAMLEAFESILVKLGLRNEITPFELEHQLRDGSVVSYGGRKYPAADIIELVMQDTAASIVSKIKNRISLEPFDAVIFTGGGVAALHDYLKAAVIDIPNAIPVKDPQMANARGYYAYGVYNR